MRLASGLFILLNAFAVLGQNALPNLRPPYAPRPADNYFTNQWYLDNRNAAGERIGADLNVRGAWNRTKGEGVAIALVDDGIETTHRDLAGTYAPELSYDFEINVTNGTHRADNYIHGTPAAGLIAAALNGIGTVGVAPGARLASWIISTTNTSGRSIVSPEKMANVFTYLSNTVGIQVHNWSETAEVVETLATPSPRLISQSPIEFQAISNAVTFGRNGKGTVIVRPAGGANFDPEFGEWFGRNVNDGAFSSDPRVIAVSAALANGRVTAYSNRGAPILVAGLSGGFFEGTPNLFTTDRIGTKGYDAVTFPDEPELADYVFGGYGYSGTTGAASLVGGVCGLILSANPNLSYRDVQQILIHASRHVDKADPDLHRNGVGYWVNHRVGYGIPDAAEAVRLAENWQPRPALVERTIASDITTNVPIPDAGLVVVARALGATPAIEQTFVAFPALGPQPDDPTPDLPLVDVGDANTLPAQDLTGKAALIQRGGSTFVNKLNNVAAKGATFAVVYNNVDDPPLTQMGSTDFVPIQAIFIRKADGETLQNLITNQPSLRVQLRSNPGVAHFDMSEQLLCEHVGVRVRTAHPIRQDLRISLVSPMGTRSVLQAFNLDDTSPGPTNWVYWSTHHFNELSSGTWSLEITDEVEGSVGDIVGAELIVRGTPIVDSDDDGLADSWEMANFGNLNQGPLDDPDGDGSWNAREQALGTDPKVNQTPFVISATNFPPGATRFAFPSVEGVTYTLRSTTDLNQPLVDVGVADGEFGETEIISDIIEPMRFFQVRRP